MRDAQVPRASNAFSSKPKFFNTVPTALTKAIDSTVSPFLLYLRRNQVNILKISLLSTLGANKNYGVKTDF